MEKDRPIDLEKETKNNYELEDMSFDIPGNLIAFDRNTSEDDLLLNAMGLTKEDLQAYLDQYDMDCVVYPYDNEFVMSFKVYKNISDSDYTDDNRLFLLGKLKSYASQCESEGYTIKQSDMIEGHFNQSSEEDGTLLWLKTRMVNDATDYIVCYTVFKGRMFLIKVTSNILSDDSNEMIDRIIQSSYSWGF